MDEATDEGKNVLQHFHRLVCLQECDQEHEVLRSKGNGRTPKRHLSLTTVDSPFLGHSYM